MRTQPGFVSDLDQLRAGTLSFTRFAKAHNEHFRAWSMAVVRRRHCEHVMTWLGVDDLVQHALLACWRAVDQFDPTVVRKGGQAAQLHTYVACQVGRAIEREVKRAAGWPRKGRKRPAKQVDPHDVSPRKAYENEHVSVIERVAHASGRSVQPTASARHYAAVIQSRFGNGLALDVTVGVLEGGSRSEIAAAVYADPERRRLYRLDCEQDARVRVKKALAVVEQVIGRE